MFNFVGRLNWPKYFRYFDTKMTAKKRWFKKFYSSESQENSIQNDIVISWSSSEEDNVPLRKKPKAELSFTEKKCMEWIKHRSEPSYRTDSQALQHPGIPVIFNGSGSSKQIDSDDSPVITKSNEWSPVLTQNKSSTEKSSPVLNKRRVTRKVKCRINDELQVPLMKTKSEESQIADSSSDLFSTQPSHSQVDNIAHDESHSELLVKQCSQFVIDDTQISQKSQNEIDPLSSQDSSEISLNSHSDRISSNSGGCLLNYNKQPVRKKRYKRGGLCSQLQRVIRTQKARVAIWQHERFVSKSDTFLTENDHSVCFSIKRQWKEFGCVLCECACLSTNQTGATNTLLSTNMINSENIFILIIGFNVIPNIKYITDANYVLYPPYSKKGVIYRNMITDCYFNVSKIQKCKGNEKYNKM